MGVETPTAEISERTGEAFDLATYLRVQTFTKRIADQIFERLETGLTEIDGQRIIKEEFLKAGAEKFWHPSKFRIGTDTTKTFRALPDATIRLESGDIVFIDVGPIFNGHESDFGCTRIFGQTTDQRFTRLASASKIVWKKASDAWQTKGLSGEALYRFVDTEATALGYKLNPLMAGHRLGDFPHALFSKDKLSEMNFRPKENLWVLEIHLIDEELERGSFYEDILTHEATAFDK